MHVPSFWKLLLLWDGDRMQVGSQHPGEADMDPGRGARVSTPVCPGVGTAALLVHGEHLQEGVFSTEGHLLTEEQMKDPT